jgi:DNA-binding transcriptional LysR family regulator
MIKRSHVRQFLAVTDTGSFTQAASRLRVTQPTLSLGIKELERLAKARLFVRDRRRVRLTEAGARFLPIARELERSFREADRFGEQEAVEWPQLRLGLIRSLAPALLEAVVATLSAEFTIELIEGTDAELRAALSNGRVHLALGLLRDGEPPDQAIALWEEPYAMLVGTAHRIARSPLTPPADLGQEIMIARRSCELLEETSRFFTRHQVRPRFALRSDSDERCLRMVAAGIGITTAPLSLAAADTVPVRIGGYDYRRTVGLRPDRRWRQEAGERFERALGTMRAGLAARCRSALPAGIALFEKRGDALLRIDFDDVGHRGGSGQDIGLG